jgi:hypothetical protein
MAPYVLEKESWPRPVQTLRHIAKVAYVDLAARKLNLLNLQLYMCIYLHISFTLLPLEYGNCSACKSGTTPPFFYTSLSFSLA